MASGIEFVVSGPPVPKARARVVRGGRAYTPERSSAYEKHVRMAGFVAMRQLRLVPFTCEVKLSLAVYWPDKRRRDLDNIAKSVSDALNGIAWKDDSQVTELHVLGSVDADAPRILVRIEERVP